MALLLYHAGRVLFVAVSEPALQSQLLPHSNVCMTFSMN